MFQKHVNAVMKTAAAQYLPRLAAAAGCPCCESAAGARIGCAGSEA